MSIARIGYPLQHQGPTTRISLSGGSQGWGQRLRRWSVARRRMRLQRLGDLCEAPHERRWIQTADSCRDFVIQESSPVLRLAIYQHVALS